MFEKDKQASFLTLVLDSITEHIVVIDAVGDIVFVNKSWMVFGGNNGCTVSSSWEGINYIEECDKAASTGDEYGVKAGAGIRKVIERTVNTFYFEYPCHSLSEIRWFMMRVSPFNCAENDYFVISHQNITERKLAEDRVKELANLDGLTQVANRRCFDQFLIAQWRRCWRSKKPICLAMIDLDYFKVVNDTYGHQFGDKCLIELASLFKGFANRPTDMFARYGGEEFVLLFSETSIEQASSILIRLTEALSLLSLNDGASSSNQLLTVSIGLAYMVPSSESNQTQLIAKADELLYKAKRNGRNRIER